VAFVRSTEFCARALLKLPVCAQTAAIENKTTENMKTKTILLIALATVIGGGVLWLAPQGSWAADTKSAGRKILGYTCPMHPSVKADKPGN
jgi:hypothetical protein